MKASEALVEKRLRGDLQLWDHESRALTGASRMGIIYELPTSSRHWAEPLSIIPCHLHNNPVPSSPPFNWWGNWRPGNHNVCVRSRSQWRQSWNSHLDLTPKLMHKNTAVHLSPFQLRLRTNQGMWALFALMCNRYICATEMVVTEWWMWKTLAFGIVFTKPVSCSQPGTHGSTDYCSMP